MVTCFVFASTLKDDGFFSLALQANGDVSAPFIWRSAEDIRKLQENAKTIVILSAAHAAIHLVEFPWLSDRKVRAAMPFVLEDLLAQPISSLHITFQRHTPGVYKVVVIENKILHDIILRLGNSGILFDLITLDWCALKAGEVLASESGILVHESSVKGFLDGNFAEQYIISHDCKVNDDVVATNIWIAQRLLELPGVQLCHGVFKPQPPVRLDMRWVYTLMVLCGIWWFSALFGMLWKTYKVHQRAHDSHHALEHIYFNRFPRAKVSMPSNNQLRASLMLNARHHDQKFWNLLHNLSAAMRANEITLEKLSYQNPVLTVILQCDEFKTLDKVQLFLVKAGTHVQQKDASTHGKQVIATLVLQ